ncbi:MAG: shikimate kinase [Clostridia bacterium]|nr:shikimate kinase [Clostridia bacterium]
MENIILIGMPSSGKSTAGRLIAKRLGYAFLDGDRLIEEAEGRPLSAIIAERGAEGFLEVEEGVLSTLQCTQTVIAPGGSAVYEEGAMAHLKSIGVVVYLKIGMQEIKRRIPDFTARGVVMRGKITSLEELYLERAPLYEKYADFSVDCTGQSPAETAEEIVLKYKERYEL